MCSFVFAHVFAHVRSCSLMFAHVFAHVHSCVRSCSLMCSFVFAHVRGPLLCSNVLKFPMLGVSSYPAPTTGDSLISLKQGSPTLVLNFIGRLGRNLIWEIGKKRVR